jgi:predicted Zn-dependent protease
MRAGLSSAVVLLCLSCESKFGGSTSAASSTPAATPPDDTNVELKRFLDGMLVTSKVPPPEESVWPVEPTQTQQLDWLKDVYKNGWGLETNEQIRAYVSTPVEKMNRPHAWLLGYMKDYPTTLRVWQKLLREDSDDLEAAIKFAQLAESLKGPKEALEGIARSSGKTAQNKDKRNKVYSPGQLEGLRCSLLFQTKRLEEARQACNTAYELDTSFGARTLVYVLLALGKKKEALVQADLVAKSPGRQKNAGALLTLGLAQQYNGLEQEARATWGVALARWPRNALLNKAISGPQRSVFDWEEDEAAQRKPFLAEDLALCGHFYSELGMQPQAQECFRQSERIMEGPSLAHQIVYLGKTKPREALALATAAVQRKPHVKLFSALAWLLLREKRVAEAKVWVERALAQEPLDVKSTSLMWQVCGEQKDYVCVIEYRKRLGLPTHFNVEQYRDVSKAWKEQAEKNGVGLSARELDSESSAKPPHTEAVVIIPLGGRVAPELDGLADFLSTHLPGLKVSIGDREDVPKEAYKIARGQIIWEELLERLREEPGRLYIVEHDLSSYDAGFSFARFDLAHGRGVVSVSRLRSLVGSSTPADTTLDGEVLAAAQNRLRSEVVGAVGKLLGISFPCSSSSCAMRERRAVTDFVLNTPLLCEKHAKELNDALSRRRASK